MTQKTKKLSDVGVNLSKTEQVALSKSPFNAIYQPTEKIPAIVVESFPELGKFAAVRFLEWVQANPGGVISLPTGKTPEFFIKWVEPNGSGRRPL